METVETDKKIELPETPEQLAMKAAEAAKNALPEKPWGGKYWEYDTETKTNVEKENPPTIKPDQPRYWAKPNCRYCYGRGIEGKITIPYGKGNRMTMDSVCSCARRRFGQWRDAFVKEWLKVPQKEPEAKPEESIDKSQELTNNTEGGL